MPPIYIAYLNRLDIEELAITDDEILSAIETSLASQGRGETVIEPRMHLEPGVANGHFNVLRGAIRAADRLRRRQDRRRLRRQLQARLSVRTRHSGAVRSAHRRAQGDPRCQRHHRHAHRRGHRDRRQVSGAEEFKGPRPYRRARHRLLERAPAQSSVRLRGDPRSFPPRGKPQCLCRTPEPRSRQEGGGNRRLAELRRRRRYRGRSVTAFGADAAAENVLDQARRAGGSLWHHERHRTVADRHHEQSSWSTIGASARAASSAACGRMSRPASSRRRRCMPNSGRSWPA